MEIVGSKKGWEQNDRKHGEKLTQCNKKTNNCLQLPTASARRFFGAQVVSTHVTPNKNKICQKVENDKNSLVLKAWNRFVKR